MSLLRSAPRKLWSFLNVINAAVPKNPKKIFLYSNLGFRDNVKAVYDYLLQNGYNNDYRIICSLNDYKEQTPQKNVRFVSNLRGLFSFFSCRYAFYCFGKYPVKPRNGQKIFNLWHGMPLKRVGNMIPGFENTDYNYFTHLLCTSEFFRDIMKKSFCCNDEQIIICGQPRTDEMVRSAENTPECEKKLMLWLPTFRNGETNELDILNHEQFKRLDSLCSRYGWKILIKLHPLSAAEVSDISELKNINIMNQRQFEKENLSLYTLLGRSGCLVTDYSSVFFDYLLTDKPIGFAVSDLEQYDSSRGFTLDDPSEYMPGKLLKNGNDFLEFAEDVFSGNDKYGEKRRQLNNIFNRYKDDENCRRAVEALGIRKKK